MFIVYDKAMKTGYHFPVARARQMEDLWDLHLKYKFSPDHRSTSLTMDTMINREPYVNHVPTLVGGLGKEDLADFYQNHFIFANPTISMTRVSRTVGATQVVDEIVISMNHSAHVDWLLPGVEATNRNVTFPLVVIVQFQEEGNGLMKISREHVYWDQATVLFQLGLLSTNAFVEYDTSALGITGVEQARKVLHPSAVASNSLLFRTGRLKYAARNSQSSESQECASATASIQSSTDL